MSNLTILGDTSGSVVLQAPAVSGSTTITFAAQSGTLNVGGPAFSAYSSTTQTGVVNSVFTKVLFDTEEYDTNNNFASSRFTPTVAGYYQVTARTDWSITSGACFLTIYKNGTGYKGGQLNGATGSGVGPIASALVYCNGSTDYIEIYAYQNNGTNSIFGGIAYTFFQAAMVRSA